MPITKETAKVLGKKGGKASAENRVERNDTWWGFVASGGLRRYRELYDKLGEGEKLNDSHKLYMEKTEKSFPYIKAKMTDITTGGKPLDTVLVKFINGKDN